MDESATYSYYWGVLTTYSNVQRLNQYNGPFYFESVIEYTSDVNLSDVQTEISKLSNDIFIRQNDTENTERILRLEEKTNNISRNGYIPSISNILNVSHVTGLKVEDMIYQKIMSIVL
jgi:hypothetical protein